MKWRVVSSKAALIGGLFLGVPACGARASTSQTAATGDASFPSGQAAAVPPAAPGSEAPDSGEPGSEGTPGADVTSDPGTPRAVPPPGVAAGRPLPRVVVQNIGLHIGGGPNDPETKSPFQKAIEHSFDDLLRCYRLVEQPEKGGTFGVDLYVAREGGSPNVRQPRTAMGGSEFRKCVVLAFERVKFERPKLGPTVISYSIRFALE